MSDTAFWDTPSFTWHDPETWPTEIKQGFEACAGLAYIACQQQNAQMFDCEITGTDEPVTMLFAIGDRAEELRRAWLSVRAIHNPSDRT